MSLEARRGQRHPLTECKGERVVIAGNGETAALAFEYFSYDSPHEIVAFTADSEFIESDTYYGLPVLSFEEVAKHYPPEDFRSFVAVSPVELNQLRGRLFSKVKALGYDCVSYVSSHAFVMPNAEIGENVFVEENCAVQHSVRLGNVIFVSSGTVVGHSSVMEDGSYTGPNASICGGCTVGSRSFVGANSCIAHGVSVAQDCLIGAGAVVLKDTEPGQVYVGAPARATGRDSLETSRRNFG
jgi:sugar O-acyltransferase (sialic acid O-acetyltransferase NeuD family)